MSGVKEFELGKTYQHSGGRTMKIVGMVDTYSHGKCYVGEEPDGGLYPVGYGDESYSSNWTEQKRGGEMNVAELIAKVNQRSVDQKDEITKLKEMLNDAADTLIDNDDYTVQALNSIGHDLKREVAK